MALINLKDLLKHAKENKYAVGSFNVTNLDFIDTLIDAAVEENSPYFNRCSSRRKFPDYYADCRSPF